MALWQHKLFSDVRLVQAPHDVTEGLLEDYFYKEGLVARNDATVAFKESASQKTATYFANPLKLFYKGKPKHLYYTLEAEGENTTRLTIRTGLGKMLAWVLYGITAVLAVLLYFIASGLLLRLA